MKRRIELPAELTFEDLIRKLKTLINEVGELEISNDSKVLICGQKGGYLHVNTNKGENPTISIDTDPLDDIYSIDCIAISYDSAEKTLTLSESNSTPYIYPDVEYDEIGYYVNKYIGRDK